MGVVVRSLLVAGWVLSWKAGAALMGVSADLAWVVPVAVLLASALVLVLDVGGRVVPVVLTVSSAWLLAVLTWGVGWASALVASSASMVVWLTREDRR
ncbi:hypothetical protein GCM10027203_18360 [Nonomuraea fastidiosa]